MPPMSMIKSLAKRGLRTLGYEVWRVHQDTLGLNPFTDIGRLVVNRRQPTIFDVGANIGQSTEEFKHVFPDCQVHGFEPNPNTFKLLEENLRRFDRVQLNNFALGNVPGPRTFYENLSPGMSSLLKPTDLAWGKVINQREVQVLTVEDYCRQHQIQSIDVLKTDAQGFDFEVVQGAGSLLKHNRIQLVMMEVIFSEQYENIVPFDRVFRFFLDHRFRLVSLYRFYHQQNLASWSDALFLNTEFKPPAGPGA